ncbi:signal recognition particle receptor subunit alpha [Candidatus Micrarchaeota archaeon]|nr:signal recognition particle receptor subunit alpha [Candidatus Micrarchaeota archaeon]
MDLGKKLRETLAKLTNKPYVDEEAVRALIKDLQRVLIASDVNVKLVFELSKRIEEKSLKVEKLKALSLKEHVLKVVYDELVALMGKSYEPRLDKHKVLLCGLFGSGKCVHKDSLIPLVDGRVEKISSIYESHSDKEYRIDDGFKVDCGTDGPLIYSFNPSTLKIEKKHATSLWKLKKDSKLMKISLENGNDHSITVTPEHPFFILDNGEVKKIRADEIKVGMRLAAPSYLSNQNQEETNFFEKIIQEFEAFSIENKELAKEVKRDLLAEYGNLLKAYEKLKIEEAYCTFTSNLKKGILNISLIKLRSKWLDFLRTGKYLEIRGTGKEQVIKKVKLPLGMDNKLAEFFGYVFGDGHLERGYVEVTNNDEEILNRLVELSKHLFGSEGGIRADKRNGVKKFFLASKPVFLFLTKVAGVPKGNKSSIMKMPDYLLKSSNETIKYFIRSYFDTDGYVEKDSRHIEFCSASSLFIQQLRILLLRFGLFSNISKRKIKDKEYYRLFLKSDDVIKFGTIISTVLKRKRERFEKLTNIEGQTPGKHQMIEVGTGLGKIRESLGFSIGEIQNYVNSYGIYERTGLISRSSLIRFLRCIENPHKNWLELMKKIKAGESYPNLLANNEKGWVTASIFRLEHQGYVNREIGQYQLTNQGAEILEASEHIDHTQLDKLRNLAYSEVCWMKVEKIEKVENEDYVYDLTVEEDHTFIANGIVVHNTTTAAKIAYFYKSKGLSVGLVGADVDRPAAQEQLEQLAKSINVNFYTARGEKNASRIVEDALKRSKDDVLIVDSAGRSAFDVELVKELKGINEALKPDETFLVVSGDVGQVAGRQAEQFNETVKISGVIVTKMDGSGKGGGALSAVAASNSKIAFIGVGEKVDDFQIYNSERFVGGLLGVPDIAGLMEKVKKISEEQDLSKLQTEEFTIQTFYEQLKAAKKMGPLSGVFSMLGAVDLPKEMVQQSEEKLKKFEAMINSMTKAEKKDASLLRKSRSRMERVASGSGSTVKEVQEFLSQFEKMEKMLGMFKKNRGFRKQVEGFMKSGKFGNLKI